MQMVKNVLYACEPGHARLYYDMLMPVMEHPDFSSTGTILAVDPSMDLDKMTHLFGEYLPVVIDDPQLGGERLISTYPRLRHVRCYGKRGTYKLSYGIGNDTWCRTSTDTHGCVNYLGWSDYDCWNIAPNQATTRISLGATKFLNHHGVDLLRAMIDPEKPTIVVVGTWRKSDAPCMKGVKHSIGGNADVCISGYSDLASVVSDIVAHNATDEYNILYKPHHQVTHLEGEEEGLYGTVVRDPRIPTQAFYDVADLVVADYSGSAVEALMAKRVIYVDELRCDAPFSDTDVVLHHMMPSCQSSGELLWMLRGGTIHVPTVEEQLGEEGAARMRRLLFGDIEHSVENWIKFLKG